MSKQQAFLEIYDKYILRDGAENLRNYLLRSDFFVAPASSKYHCAYEGGLCEHSVNTYLRLLDNITRQYGNDWESVCPHETVAISALLHDICKVNYYKTDYRNVKENGEWVKRPYYAVEEDLPYGHGEKSVYIIQSFMNLTREEAVAINWHMGGFDARVKGGDGSISQAFCKFPLAVLLHVSDLQATYIDEKRGV